MSDAIFSSEEWLRYTRHIQLPQIAAAGQTRLKKSRVLIVGAGGLGSPVALYLAAAGVGHITIIDGDTIDLTNLQRQILFSTEQVGQMKAVVACQRLLALNPDICVEAVTAHLRADNVERLISQVDLVVDCTDNFTARYLINDNCVALQKPWVFASIYQFSGQCALFTPASACFRCLFPEPPQILADCNAAGVLGVLPGLLGTLQANEAIKYLAGLHCALENNLLLVEALDVTTKKIRLAKNTACKVCGSNTTQQADNNRADVCLSAGAIVDTIAVDDFVQLQKNSTILLLDVRSLAEREAFHLDGIHIPLDELSQRVDELPRDKRIICYCQTGVRSQKAVVLLKDFELTASSLQGGIVAFLKVTLHTAAN
jgi:adenylyltransferase/sulfurtransferase